jgi:hypothetical protein
MNEDRPMLVARISAEISALTDLSDVCRWLIECQQNPLRVDADHLPALGQHSLMRVARPVTAPRAVLCTLWLVEEADGGGCLVAGILRFVGHPTASGVRLSFEGRTVPTGRGDRTAFQLLELIAASIGRTRTVAYGEMAS